jgi:hypothetical protein
MMLTTKPIISLFMGGALLLAAGATAPAKAEDATVFHTVVFWLKPGTPAAKVDEIMANAQNFENLPMVDKVMVGTPIMSDRKVVDDSFSIAFTMTFKDEAALQAYNADPHHKKLSAKVTLPHVARGIIYDYKSK